MRFLVLSFFFIISISALGQLEQNHVVYQTLKANDSLIFEVAFNHCNIQPMEELLSDDLEFYHDIAGVEKTKAVFINNFRNGLCGNPNVQSRRELIPESLVVYPLKNNGVIYGAVQQGEHRFFEKVKNQPETAGSTAKFTHLWLLENDTWKLKRVISYDHQQSTNH
ncbi:hypothetical protein GCM10009117_10200 [Gangjinia marincola]|uniref:DUF4440 domain-containing protein n=1 Tax=Gangjinia marincola TaxID=578463 RepID=A0ABN1MGE2_9FLAO